MLLAPARTSLEVNTIKELYSLVNKPSHEVYKKMFQIKKITIRTKLSIVAACLNDQKFYDNDRPDPKTRNGRLKKAAQSLEVLVAKKCISNMQEESS